MGTRVSNSNHFIHWSSFRRHWCTWHNEDNYWPIPRPNHRLNSSSASPRAERKAGLWSCSEVWAERVTSCNLSRDIGSWTLRRFSSRSLGNSKVSERLKWNIYVGYSLKYVCKTGTYLWERNEDVLQKKSLISLVQPNLSDEGPLVGRDRESNRTEQVWIWFSENIILKRLCHA